MSAQKALNYPKQTPFCYLNCSGTLKSPRMKLAVPRCRQHTELGVERVVDTKNNNFSWIKYRGRMQEIPPRERRGSERPIDRASEASSRKRNSNVRGAAPKPRRRGPWTEDCGWMISGFHPFLRCSI